MDERITKGVSLTLATTTVLSRFLRPSAIDEMPLIWISPWLGHAANPAAG